jgi:hypothetical protein
MDPATWDLVIQILPWALLGVIALGWWLYIKSVELKKVQRAAHQANKMGMKELTDLLDAIARSDRPAILSIVEKLVEEYGSEDGVMLFAWNVFNDSIDDLLESPAYGDRVGRRLEDIILGTLITEEQQVQLGMVGNNFATLGLKSASAFFQGLATGKITPVKNAIRDIISRFSQPDHVDDEIVKLAPGIVAGVKKDHPELLPNLRAALLTAEESAKLA